MSSLRTHFEGSAVELADHAALEVSEQEGATMLTLRPRTPTAVAVVLHLLDDKVGTVALDDPACVPAELGNDPVADLESIDYFVSVAVQGRATAFHLGRGGCVEIQDGEDTSRSWRNAWPWPGWRRRAERIEYEPYS
ncbi:hypothetical protein GCM10009623_00960 [Nocardioides aestuarii]|uniref:Uncharacterized protein n=1 Tax=Nocardioides aestuarii TaxID=252231 RepID=A0ABW4TJN9_9ACTN